MWYAIVGAAGLVLGLGLLVWALTERGARHAAERSADEAKTKEEAMRLLASRNAAAAQNLEMEHGRMSEQITILRNTLCEAHKRLAASGDPQAVKSWLDDELKGGPV